MSLTHRQQLEQEELARRHAAERQEIADKHIPRLLSYARAMESEGDYRAAQEASDEAAKWQLWAEYGAQILNA